METTTSLQESAARTQERIAKNKAAAAAKKSQIIDISPQEQAPVVPETPADTETPVEQPVVAKAETAKPEKGGKRKPDFEKFFGKAEEEKKKTTENTQYEEWKKKAELYDSLQNDTGFVALNKARAEGKDLLDVANELARKNPKNLTTEQLFRMVLNDVGVVDESEVEENLEGFMAEPKWKQHEIIARKRESIEQEYNRELSNFRSTYTPQEALQTKNLKEFEDVISEYKGKQDFWNTITYDDTVLEKTKQAIGNAKPVDIMRAFSLLSNIELITKNIYEAGFNEAIGQELEQLQGNTERSVVKSNPAEKEMTRAERVKKQNAETRERMSKF